MQTLFPREKVNLARRRIGLNLNANQWRDLAAQLGTFGLRAWPADTFKLEASACFLGNPGNLASR